MILPPAGSERGSASDDGLVELERFLLGEGVRVVSSGITGRAVADDSRGGSAVASLSDLERALILARDSNADGLLQVIRMGWKDKSRNYVLEGDAFVQTTEASRYSRQVQVLLSVYVFQARLIAVESGEVVASFDIRQNTADVERIEQVFEFTNRSPSVEYDTRTEHRRTLVAGQTAERIAARLRPRTER